MQALAIPMPLDTVVPVIHGGDTQGSLVLPTDDCVVHDNGDRYVGKSEIRTWSDRELIGAKSVMTVHGIEEHGWPGHRRFSGS